MSSHNNDWSFQRNNAGRLHGFNWCHDGHRSSRSARRLINGDGSNGSFRRVNASSQAHWPLGPRRDNTTSRPGIPGSAAGLVPHSHSDGEVHHHTLSAHRSNHSNASSHTSTSRNATPQRSIAFDPNPDRGNGPRTHPGVDQRPHPRVSRFSQAWKAWPELTIELRDVPVESTMLDIWEAFRRRGNIVWMDRAEVDRGLARIRFSPVPDESFWNEDTVEISFKSKSLRVRVSLVRPLPRRMMQSSSNRGFEYPERIRLHPSALDFGYLSESRSMDIMKTIHPWPSSSSLLHMTVDLKYKEIHITFPCFITDPRRTDSSIQVSNAPLGEKESSKPSCFKAQIRFSHVQQVYRVDLEDDHWALIIPLPSPPAFFHRRKDISKSFSNNKEDGAEKSRWSEQDTWQRATEISYAPEWAKHEPTSLKSPYPCIDISKWTTYRLRFRASENQIWETLKNALLDFNVDVNIDNESNFKFQPGKASTFWSKIDGPVIENTHAHLALLSDDYYLPFEVRYQLEAAISQGIFTEQSITANFLQKLAKLNRERTNFTNPAKNILEYFTDAGKRTFDPMSIFDNNRALQHHVRVALPEHCMWVRKVVVTPTTVHLGSPTVEVANRVLRQYATNSDRFIRVQFTDERCEGRIRSIPDSDKNDHLFERVFRTLQNGIKIGDHHFHFLAYGNSQFRENGAYFFCPTDAQSCDDIRDWMGEFRHIRVVAKYAARLGQCFSTTRSPRGIAVSVNTIDIPDIETNGWCFSDGVGKISGFLADEIATRLGMRRKHGPPSAFQFRLGGSKGIVVTWPEVPFNQVHLRPSQKKFNAVAKNIEIIRPSRYSVATLNRQVIAILSCLGVPNRVLIDLTKRQLSDYQRAMEDPSLALKLLSRFIDENGVTTSIAQMINDGFMASKEPFMQTTLQLWRVWSMKLLRDKARIIVEDSAHLLGCVDETCSLRGHTNDRDSDRSRDRDILPQIFLQVPKVDEPDKYRVITSICLVGRNPSLHPGDLRIVEAVDVPALHHLRDVVVFPAKGEQDIPSMCSGGDLDGDDFFVIWDPVLIPKEWNHTPLIHDVAQAQELDRDVQIEDIMKFFVSYMKNNSLSMIAHAHMAQADWEPEGPKSKICIDLAKLHSNAVDYVKSGRPAVLTSRLRPRKYPHFMGKAPKSSYTSRKILGQLHDLVTTENFTPIFDSPFDRRILCRYLLSDEILTKARGVKSEYDMAMRRIMNQHEIKTEFEVWSTFVLSKPRVGTDYKLQEDMGLVMVGLRDRFIEACRKAAGATEESIGIVKNTRVDGSDLKTDGNENALYKFIAAMYRVTWEEVQITLQQCSENVIVAGRTVSKQMITPDQAPMITFPWIFEQELGRIATSSKEKMELDNLPTLLIVKMRERDGIGAAPAVEIEDGRVFHRGHELFAANQDHSNEPIEESCSDLSYKPGDDARNGDLAASEAKKAKSLKSATEAKATAESAAETSTVSESDEEISEDFCQNEETALDALEKLGL